MCLERRTGLNSWYRGIDCIPGLLLDVRLPGGVSSAVFLSVVSGVRLGLGVGLMLNGSKLVVEADSLPVILKSIGVRFRL